MITNCLLLLLVVCGWVYWIFVWRCTRCFFRRPAVERSDWAPPVSILKPVKGLDPSALANFRSFCCQDYPEFELLFGVASEDDPVVPAVRQLASSFPDRRIRLIIERPEGANPKTGMLAHLARAAAYDHFVINDSDMRAPADYLRRVVAPLADPRTGLVTCLYRGTDPLSPGARLEAVSISSSFLPQSIVGTCLPGQRFAFGATMALSRATLERIGGFEAMADYLADDFQLGARVERAGLGVQVSDCVVDNVIGSTTFRELWARHVRWARTIRVSRPRHYPGLLLTFTTPLSLLLWLAAGGAAWAAAAVAVSLALRWAIQHEVCCALRQRQNAWRAFWLPIADIMAAAVWCAGTVGRKIIWRGAEYRLQADGRLVRANPSVPRRTWLLDRGVRALDAWLRRRQQIREYSQRADCLLRLSVSSIEKGFDLADGTHLAPGEPIGELHLWNEHLARLPAGAISRAKQLQSAMELSLAELAACAQTDAALQNVRAFRADMPLAAEQCRTFQRLACRMGFQALGDEPPQTALGRFGESIYLWALAKTFGSTAASGRRRVRHRYWLSRSDLLAHFAAPLATQNHRGAYP